MSEANTRQGIKTMFLLVIFQVCKGTRCTMLKTDFAYQMISLTSVEESLESTTTQYSTEEFLAPIPISLLKVGY